ncbi:DUF2634 domain-containing protein [Bacillus badius]|uniref:Phage baseplate wedge n=1 Tax=Bacillus badius TaxID=1455 RepID=A0ABR5AP17_BACBA|nr:DUF2634 domain-containing protein [Bacillus badius]KIL72515.1 Phage baseplate wedge [Bacillus badius]MED4718294.1 DUF2634 domain-containing protein [Bacillus badius]
MIAPKIENGDIVIKNGEWVFVEGDEELAQSVESVLQTQRGEFFLDEEGGLRHENLFGKHTDENVLRDDIIEAVSQEDRVNAVTDIQIIDDKKARKRSVLLSIEKENKQTIRNIQVPLGEGGR